MADTPNLNAFRDALAATGKHEGWEARWALSYYEAQCIFDGCTTKDLAACIFEPNGLPDLSTEDKAEAHLVDLLANWDDETPAFEAILEALP